MARDHVAEALGLFGDGLAGGRGLLYKCRVLLGRLIHLHDGLVHLFDACGLLAAGICDLGDYGGELLYRGDDLRERLTGLADQLAAFPDLADAILNQDLDLLGGGRTAAGKVAHLARRRPRSRGPVRRRGRPRPPR